MNKLKNTKKLLIAGAALVAAVAVSAGATYAWFTQNESVSVSGISATVKTVSDNNIMVAVGHPTGTSGVTYKTSLSSDDLSAYMATAMDAVTVNVGDGDGQYTIASSTGAVPFVNVENDDASAYSSENTDGTYIKIPISIKTDTAASIILDSTGSKVTTTETVSSTVTMWQDSVSYGNNGSTVGSELTAYACNATRVGFTSLQTSDKAAYNGTETNLKVWNANEAMYSGAQTDGNSTSDRTSLADNNYWKNNLAGDYKVYTESVDKITQQTYSNYVAPESSTETETYAFATTAMDGSSSAYAFIYIYIWIEGTDGDCFNNILSQSVSVEMTFKAATAEDTGD